jgi:hypothetical protein
MTRSRSVRAKSPERSQQWVGDAFGDPDETQEGVATELDDDERDGEADEGAGKDVGRVMGADEDPPDPDRDRRREEERADEAIVEKDREGDGERRAGVVAREGGIVRSRPCRARKL